MNMGFLGGRNAVNRSAYLPHPILFTICSFCGLFRLTYQRFNFVIIIGNFRVYLFSSPYLELYSEVVHTLLCVLRALLIANLRLCSLTSFRIRMGFKLHLTFFVDFCMVVVEVLKPPFWGVQPTVGQFLYNLRNILW